MRERIHIAYCGAAVDNGYMDVKDLAPALLAFGDLVREANKIANADASNITVYVDSNFQQGSFEITLDAVQTIGEQIRNLFFSNQTYTLREVLDVLGLAAGLTGANVLELIRWLQNRKVTKVERLEDGKARIYSKEEYYDISVLGFNIFRSVKARENIEKLISPLKTEGVSRFEVRHSNGEKQCIKEDEIAFYAVPTEENQIETVETTQKCVVSVVSVNFENGLKWRFSMDSLNTFKIYAIVQDEDFYKQVEDGKIAFYKGMSLLVDLRIKQILSSTGHLKTEYFVLKVHRIIDSSKQMSLDFE